ncbi:MAG: NAD-glutamate dehydrogenase [Magnetococcus sp. WYHC-3]
MPWTIPGGVDLSDHEVNLKILFDLLVRQGELPSMAERNRRLAGLTEQVARKVLADNHSQHQAISRDQLFSCQRPEVYLEALDLLVEQAHLHPGEAQIPPRDILNHWLEAGEGLPRPLLAVMMGHAKLLLNDRLLRSRVVDMFFFERYLAEYFPDEVSREFAPLLGGHFLKREIITTSMVNRVVDQTGFGPLLHVYHKLQGSARSDEPLPTLVKAYLIVESMLAGAEFRRALAALPEGVPFVRRYDLQQRLEAVLLHLAGWMLAHMDGERISVDLIMMYGKVIGAYREHLWGSLPQLVSRARLSELEARRDELVAEGIPSDLAVEAVLLPFLKDTMAILHIKERLHVPFEPVGQLYIQVDDHFGLSWLDESLQRVRHRDHWGRLNLENVRRELWQTRTRLVQEIIAFKRHNESVTDAFGNYLREVGSANVAYQTLLTELQSGNAVELVPLTVLVRQLRGLLQSEQTGELL